MSESKSIFRFDAFEIAMGMITPFFAIVFHLGQGKKALKIFLVICQFTIGIPIMLIMAAPFLIFSICYVIYDIFRSIISGEF